jgi:hypothetical protein
MTRKDFELIAGIIVSAYYLDADQKETIAKDFADELSMTNARFNRETFLNACGVNE